jgi:two-component system chemotaxis response regulator CheB
MATRDAPDASGHDIIVIGSSAGGIQALKVLVGGLPPDLPAALFVVQHLAPQVTSVLPQLLTRAGPLPVAHPQDGEVIQPGRIYVAPPDYHLTLVRGQMQVGKGPKEHGLRPAIDPLFRSAARAYGRRVVGVILTGLRDDGTAGLIAVKVAGGAAVVQDPTEAAFADMPRNALRYLEVDYCLALAEISPVLVRLTQRPVPRRKTEMMGHTFEQSDALIQQQMAAVERGEITAGPALFSCPDCGGTLWRFQEGAFTQLQCRIGHRYTPESFLALQEEALEQALWTAVRLLDERASLAQERVQAARAQHDQAAMEAWEHIAHEAQHKAALLRQLLT